LPELTRGLFSHPQKFFEAVSDSGNSRDDLNCCLGRSQKWFTRFILLPSVPWGVGIESSEEPFLALAKAEIQYKAISGSTKSRDSGCDITLVILPLPHG
jgi:hypothetical protein